MVRTKVLKYELRSPSVVNMKKTLRIALLFSVTTALSMSLSTPLLAEGGKAAKAGPSGESIQWYDGDRQRSARLNPELKAMRSHANTVGLVPAESSRARSTVNSENTLDVYQVGGQTMALTGGIIVRFKAGWDEAAIRSWMAGQGFDSFEAIVGDHIWLADTAPGIAGLRKANQIHESGEVVYATPNWWQARSLR